MEAGMGVGLYELLSRLAFYWALNGGHGGPSCTLVCLHTIPKKVPCPLNNAGKIDCSSCRG